ncbi:MAG: RidA family protein [Actinomycetota bacterium]|nr:RidA family protein [Actinomycetota bacterium]
MSRHHLFNPEGMTPPYGFSHGALADEGRTLHIAGQTGHHPDLDIDEGLVEQFAQACRAVSRVIEEAGGKPDDLVSLTIYTTEINSYRENLGPIGAAYREVFGRHFPPMALIGVTELFDPRSVVELVGVAVVGPDRSQSG